MGSYWLHDLPTVLSSLNVDFYSGWETRSRSSGGYDKVLGVVIHHTASNSSSSGDMAWMWQNCPDRPVGAIYLARDGKITVGAAGATNCQGKGGPITTSKGSCPKDKGNQYFIAIEAANNGVGEPWPQEQTDSYLALVHALCNGYGFTPASDIHSHYSYCEPSCKGRKIDPAGPSPFGSINNSGTWDINQFRASVGGTVPPTPVPIPPTPVPVPPSEDWMANLPNLKKGDSGADVKRMQHLLASNGFMNEANVSNYDGVWGNGTDNAKKNFDNAHGLASADTDCGPKSWESLMTGRVW